jgi:hypothetical protein
MKHYFLILSFFLASCFAAVAQHNVQSMVFDSKNGLALEMATVRLYNLRDSALVQGCKTNANGSFLLTKVIPGSYSILVSMVGYKDHRQTVNVASKELILKNIHLEENSQLLSTVEVTGTAAQMVVKGDTTEFNATAFKTAQNAVVEDLLKRLPGVEVSSDGKITVNGQDIKKIRVDGKKFFDGDIEMATKNIPAEMIDKVQVLDQKSDMAILTGFEDNDTERIINITTKANRKHGVFGNVTGGIGADLDKNVRYDSNGFLNIMNNDSQSAITGGANNINTSRSGRGRGGMGNPSGGITETQNMGINNNTTVSPKLKIGGDASLNHSDNLSLTESDKQTFLKDSSTYTNHSKNKSMNENYSANMRLEVEWKPDTLNTIVLQPNIGYNRSFSDNTNSYTYLTGVDTTSVGNSSNHGNGTSLDASLNVIFSHKFASKKGRAFTTNLQTGLSHSNNESWNKSEKLSAGVQPSYIDQYTTNLSDRYNVSLRMSFVEPLWNVRNLLETSLSLRSTNSESEKNQYQKLFDNTYSATPDTTYSNVFQNTYYSEALEINYRYVAKTYNLMMGMKGEPSQTTSLRTYANGMERPYNNNVLNFSPTARFQYNFGKKQFARLDYRGQSNQPSISQMQPVKNNSNQMNETVGNPTLNPEFNHNFRMFYSAFNDVTFSSFNVMLNAQATKDALVTNSIYDVTGKQYSQTVNSGATPYNLFGNIMFNTPIIQKRLHFNTNTSFGLDRRYGYSKKGETNIITDSFKLGNLSNTRKYSASQSLAFTFTNDVFEIGVKGNLRYSNTYNNLSNKTSQTYDWTGGGNAVLHLPYNINVASDLNYTTLKGYSTFDNSQLIWNASIDKSFFNNKGVLALKMFDILHQQLNIRQIIGDNYIQYSSFNTLRSYFLLSFTYKINQFKGTRNSEQNQENRFGPGGDRPRRGDGGGNGGGGGFGGGRNGGGGGGPEF